MKRKRAKPSRFTVAGLFLLIYFFRVIEFFRVRSDQSALGEAILHLILSLVILPAVLARGRMNLRQIGFTKTHSFREIFNGALFACAIFFLSFSLERFILQQLGRDPEFKVYVSKYVLNPEGNDHLVTLNAFALLAGGLLSAFVEEGIFRGLFITVAEKRYGFYKAVLISSFLYAIWANVPSLRYFSEGGEGFFTGILIGGIALISYFFLGIKYALEFELTGSLWFPLSEHFLHYILLRVLHVKTAYGTDELYLMRQAFTQALSLICVLAVFLAIRHFSDQQGGERGL